MYCVLPVNRFLFNFMKMSSSLHILSRNFVAEAEVSSLIQKELVWLQVVFNKRNDKTQILYRRKVVTRDKP